MIQLECGTDAQHIICSLYVHNPLSWLESRVWMVWGPHYNDNFLSCGAQLTVILMCYTHKERNTEGWGCSNSFLQLLFGKQIVMYSVASTVFNFLLQQDTRLEISLLGLPSPCALAFITQEFFPKPRLVIIAVIVEGNVSRSMPLLPFDTIKCAVT